MNDLNEIFWESSIDEIKKGYIESNDNIKCLICGESFELNRVYEVDKVLYNAKGAVEMHIEKNHISSLKYLLNMNSVFTGVSESQKNVLELIAEGYSDKEIAKKLNVANSTIRNHRYKLREKEKQAKLFLAMMELMKGNTNKGISKLEKEVLVDPHKTATTLDDRFNITDVEKDKVIASYIDETGALKSYPSKEKKKIIVLEAICKNFKSGKIYSERELNIILKRLFEDYVTIRRALIEYGFLERKDDCTEYWVKK